MKGHSTFLEAAGRLVHRCQNVRLICVGEGVGRYVSALKERAERLGLNPSLIWAGPRDDMPAVYSAFDIACSSSTGEGFSNAIAEAMACNLPTIATDVGDSARIVGDTVSVVTPEDPASLAAALERLAKMPANERRALGAACRERIVSEFGIDRLIQRTEQALELA